MEDSKINYYGIVSIIFGILSWIVLGLIFAPIGLVFGIIGASKNNDEKALAIIGVILNLISLLIIIVSIMIVR